MLVLLRPNKPTIVMVVICTIELLNDKRPDSYRERRNSSDTCRD